MKIMICRTSFYFIFLNPGLLISLNMFSRPENPHKGLRVMERGHSFICAFPKRMQAMSWERGYLGIINVPCITGTDGLTQLVKVSFCLLIVVSRLVIFNVRH